MLKHKNTKEKKNPARYLQNKTGLKRPMGSFRTFDNIFVLSNKIFGK